MDSANHYILQIDWIMLWKIFEDMYYKWNLQCLKFQKEEKENTKPKKIEYRRQQEDLIEIMYCV